MLEVLENAKGREQVASDQEELYLAGEESDQAEQLSEFDITPQKKELELGE